MCLTSESKRYNPGSLYSGRVCHVMVSRSTQCQSTIGRPYLPYVCFDFLADSLRMLGGFFCYHGKILDLVLIIALEVLERLSK